MIRPHRDVAGLVPHTGVARFLIEIVAVTADTIHAMGAIPSGHVLATGGTAPAFLAIELGAQAAAAMEAMGHAAAASDKGARQPGHLVRIREASFPRATLPVDTPIHITAELMGAAPPLAIYRLSASLDEAVILTAVISTHAGPIGGAS